MTEPYVPTTEEVRRAATEYGAEYYSYGILGEEFDRWFEAEIAKAARAGAEEALRIVMEEPVTFRGTNE